MAYSKGGFGSTDGGFQSNAGGGGAGFSGSYLPDTDAQTDLGRVVMHSSNSDWAMISHYDEVNANDFMIAQLTGGRTQVNCALGQRLDLCKDGSTFVSLLSSGDFAPDNPTSLGSATKPWGTVYAQQFSTPTTPVVLSASSGQEDILNFAATIEQTGTASFTGMFIDITETTTGSGTRLPIAVDVGGANVFQVNQAGYIKAGTGSAAAPSIAGTAATNYGLHFTGGNTVGITAAGSAALTFDSSSDGTFFGEHHGYAEIYVTGGSTAQTLNSTGGVFDKLTGFTTDGDSRAETAAAASDKITVSTAGEYQVSWQASFTGDNSETYTAQIYVNGSGVAGTKCKRKLGTGTDVGSMSITAIVVAAASDDIEVYMAAAGNSAGFTPEEMQLVVVQL